MSSENNQGPEARPAPEIVAVLAGLATRLIRIAAVVLVVIAGYAILHRDTLLTRVPQVFAYTIVPVVLCPALLWAARRLSPIGRVRLAMVLASVVGSAYVATALLSIWPQGTETIGPPAGASVAFDRRTPLQVAEAMRAEGIPAVQFFAPLNMMIGPPFARQAFDGSPVQLPLAGISGRPTVYCNETGEYLTYTSDEHGFHNPPGAWTAGDVDIALVGDSFTHGACVPSEKNIAGVLTSEGHRVLNLGIAGGPLQMLGHIKEYLRSVQPRTVVWLFYEGNDLIELDLERDQPALTDYVRTSSIQGLRQHQPEIDRRLVALERRLRTEPEPKASRATRVLRFVTLGAVRERLSLTPRSTVSERLPEDDIELLRSIFREAEREVSAWNGKLYFVYLPGFQRYKYPDRAPKFKDEVVALARDAGMPVIDVDEAFRELPDPLDVFPFRRSGHYTVAGYRIVAQTIADELGRN